MLLATTIDIMAIINIHCKSETWKTAIITIHQSGVRAALLFPSALQIDCDTNIARDDH